MPSLNAEQTSVVTQAVPLGLGTAGVDLRAGAASRSPAALRELLNARFLHDRALAKRPGHDLSVLRAASTRLPQVEVEEVRPWLYGWGDTSDMAYASSPTKPPSFPIQTRGAGIAVVDDTLVAFTGDRLLTHRQDNREWLPGEVVGTPGAGGHPCYVASANRADRFYSGETESSYNTFYDVAVGPVHEVTIRWQDPNLRMSVRDRKTDSVVEDAFFLQSAAVTSATVVYSAGYFVAIWNVATDLYYSYATDAEPNDWAFPAIWDNGSDFDVEVVSDDLFIVAFRDTTSIRVTYWSGNSIQQTPAAPGTALTLGNTPIGALAITAGRDGDLGLVFVITNQVRGGVYTASGATRINNIPLTSAGAYTRVATAAHWNYTGASLTQFTFWASRQDTSGFTVTPYTRSGSYDAGGTSFSVREYHQCYVNTRGFRVGNLACAGLLYSNDYLTSAQCQNVIVAHSAGQSTCRVVASYLRGELSSWATTTPGGGTHVTGVRPVPGQSYGLPGELTTPEWVVSYLRYPPVIGTLGKHIHNQARIYLNFLPTWSAAQYGRALYIAGSVVQAFDGRTVTEAGFLQYPEIMRVLSTASGGSIVPGEIRAYRIYAIHTNAAGEVARSPAVTVIAAATAGATNNNTISFSPVSITNRTDVSFEVYATGPGPGATFYRIGTVSNNLGTNILTFVDGVLAANLLSNEPDPHPALPGYPGELLETALPGCDILVAGKGRLWMAGGQLPRGRVAHTKLREETEQAGWDDLAGYLDVDATGRDITSLGVMSDVLVAFQEDGIYGVQGEGPNNLGIGAFPAAQLLAPGTGAVTHAGTTNTEVGMVFWAEAGPRLLTTGFQTTDISPEVEPLARTLTSTLTSAVSVPGLRECRWYTSTGTALMWDYSGRGELGNRWSVWNNLPAASAVYYAVTDGAVLISPTGSVLLENAEAETDGGAHYEFAWRTGDIRPTGLLQGNNRFISFAVTGEYKGPHTLGCWTYYDDAPMWDDYFTWDPAEYLAVVPWGSGTGVWNTDDTAWINTATTESPDGVYRFSRRLPRDKGALLSVRVSDQSAPNNSFIINEIAFNLAAENGLTKTPPRTFGGNPQ